MEHWRSVLPIKMIEVSYQHMVMDTKATMQNVLDCLGVEWDDSCIEPHTNPCTVETASNWQVRQPDLPALRLAGGGITRNTCKF